MNLRPPDRAQAVDELVARIEGLVPCEDGMHAYQAQTGDPYVQFSLRGDDLPGLCAHMEDLLRMYVEPRLEAGARLFWRYDRPRIVWFEDDMPTPPMGRLQTRLVVSAKPIAWRSLWEYDRARRVELERELLGVKPN